MTKLLILGIVFSSAVNAEVVAKPLILSILFSISVILAVQSNFQTSPLVSGIFFSKSDLSYTVFLHFYYISLLKSTGAGTNLSISNLSTSAFKLAKSNLAASLDVSIPVVFFKSAFVA